MIVGRVEDESLKFNMESNMSTIVQEAVKRPLGFLSPRLVKTSDWLGMVASIGCAIHCAAMPFVIASLPSWGLSFLADEFFHKWMALICMAIAITAFVPGWRKHRMILPVALGGFGLALISLAAFAMEGQCCATCASLVIESNEQDGLTQAGCNDSCCEACSKTAIVSTLQADPATENFDGTEQTSWTNLRSSIAPWLTPIGALTLVVAHLLNRRFAGSCDCCPNPTLAAR